MEEDQVYDAGQVTHGYGPHSDDREPDSERHMPCKFHRIWTKRQNPEWKPRRASVASCHQQQEQLMVQHYGYKTTYQFNLTSANIRELIVQKRLQYYQQQRNEITIDPCAHNDAIRKFQDQDTKCGKICKNVHQDAARVAQNEELKTTSTFASTFASSIRKPDNGGAKTHSTVTKSELKDVTEEARNKRSDSSGKFDSDGDSVCQANHDSGKTTVKDGISSPGAKELGLKNQELSDIPTCCSHSVVSGCESDCGVGSIATLESSMNEKFHIQNEQRKHVILTMALKQMMVKNNPSYLGNKALVVQDFCQCSCRSRSCSVSSAKMLARDSVAPSALTRSRSGLFDDVNDEAITKSPTEGSSTKHNEGRAENGDLLEPPPTTIDDDSFIDIIPHQPRRCSATFEQRTLEDHKTSNKMQLGLKKRFNQARNSIDEDLVTEMRHLVTSKNSPDCENNQNNGTPWRSSPIEHCDCGPDSVLDSRPGSMFEQYHKITCEDKFKRSSSAAGKSNVTSIRCSSKTLGYSSNQNESNLEALIVESWLDDHPSFTRDYIMRKATRQVVDEWLVANAKVSNTNLSSQVDIRSVQTISRPMSQISLGSYLREPSWKGSELIVGDIDESSSQNGNFGLLRANRSNSQSACVTNRTHGFVTPMRKISATDFETRTGSGFLRPMLSKTPDGRLTFLPQTSPIAPDQIDSLQDTKVSKKADTHQSSACETLGTSRLDGSRATIGAANESDSPNHLDQENKDTRERENDVENDAELKLIFELVENIYDDLDIRTLLHKILKNIAVLINADRSSLFLVCGGPGDVNRRLVSQLFNVDQDSIEVGEPEESITIPWGTGLVGFVAASGQAVNITNCYEDPRFTDAIDQRTGYVTKHMLCAPILDKHNEIVGVAQVINKRDGNPFSKTDELKFKRYLQFCGIGLRNAQSYEQCQLENRRNQVLLDLARMVFEEQSTIEQVVYRIMLHTQSLLDCERCQALLIDDGNEELDNLHQFSSYRSTIQNNDLSAQRRVDKCSKYRDLILEKRKGVAKNQLDDANLKPNLADQFQRASPKLFSLVFDLECDGNDPVIHKSKEDDPNSGQSLSKQTRAFPINIGITGYVALTGETLNIENAHEHERFDVSVDEGSAFKHKSILCMPIRNGQRQIIGVIQLINKKNGQAFNKNDEHLFEAFAIFCGLGIHNTLMYERVLKVMAKQRVTFEVLSYHATAPLEEAKKLSQEQVPSCFALNLTSLKFNDFSLDEQYMLKSCLRFFLDLDLIRRFQIDQLVFCNWILSVQKNYRKVTYHPIVGGNGLKASPVRYHNWRHAFNVSQMMFAILVNTQICESLGELETLALLIACLCHDLDHRGTNNSFQIKSASPLAELYSTSTMEHHHFDQCVMILNSQGNQILSNLSPDEYSRVIRLLEEAILATDLANYFRNRDHFFQLVNSKRFNWQNDSQHRSLLRCMLMTACDVAAITKPWPVQKVVADLVMSEFYQQGDIEKSELNIEPIDMMNRDKMSELPSMQISFIDNVCAPIYTAFAKLFPSELTTLLDGCLSNRNLWKEVADSGVSPDLQLVNYLTCDNEEQNEKWSSLADSCASKSDTELTRSRAQMSRNNSEWTMPSDDSTRGGFGTLPVGVNQNYTVTGDMPNMSTCVFRRTSQRKSV